MAGSKSKFLVPLAAIIIGFSVAFVLAEVVVRIFYDHPVNPRFIMDSGYGIRDNQPNVETSHYVPDEYEVDIATNSAGMRGQKEYTLEKPDGVYRIALIGDSFIYGFGVEDNNVMAALLEKQLNDKYAAANKSFEVLNFGVAGFGQAEELVLYRNKIIKYNPDDVVLFYFNNDIGNNAVANLYRISEQGGIESTGNQYLPGVKAREMLYSFAPIRWLSEYSRAWSLVRNRLSAIVQKHLLKKKGMKRFDDATPESIELTRVLIKEFIKEIQDDGASATLFVIPHQSIKSNFPLTGTDIVELNADYVDGREFLESGDYYRRDSHWRLSGNIKAANALEKIIATHALQ